MGNVHEPLDDSAPLQFKNIPPEAIPSAEQLAELTRRLGD